MYKFVLRNIIRAIFLQILFLVTSLFKKNRTSVSLSLKEKQIHCCIYAFECSIIHMCYICFPLYIYTYDIHICTYIHIKNTRTHIHNYMRIYVCSLNKNSRLHACRTCNA